MSFHYLSEPQGQTVHRWWDALQVGDRGNPNSNDRPVDATFASYNRGTSARLRRSTRLQELEMERACFQLRDRLGPIRPPGWTEGTVTRLNELDADWLLLIAGTVARVRTDTGKPRSLALALGKSAAQDGVAPMSETRFRRLLKEDQPESFFRGLRRALDLAGGELNVAQLADDLLAWTWERSTAKTSVRSLRYRWASDYFLAPKDRRLHDQTTADLSAPSSGIAASQETHA